MHHLETLIQAIPPAVFAAGGVLGSLALASVMNVQDRASVSSGHSGKVDLSHPEHQPHASTSPKTLDEDIEQNPGVARVEALHRHLSGGWVWMLYISIAALSYVYSLDQNTTSNYLPLATSSFGQHSFIGTIGTAEGIISKSCRFVPEF